MAVKSGYITLPTVALRGIVAFPTMRLHFEVGRKKSIEAVMAAMKDNQEIFLVSQGNLEIEEPTYDDLYSIGVIAQIKQIIKSPDSPSIKIVIEGIGRAKLQEGIDGKNYLLSNVKKLTSTRIKAADRDYAQALLNTVKETFEQYIEATAKQAPEVYMHVMQNKDPDYLSDYIASNVLNNLEDRQEILQEINPIKRLEKLCVMLTKELEMFFIEDSIKTRVQEQIDKNQQEYYLREQMKAISLELGEGEDSVNEIKSYLLKIESVQMPQEVKDKLTDECKKLSKMQSSSPDANIIRTYLDTSLKLPWGIFTKDVLNLNKARKVLDTDHFGLDKVKEKFIEMLAVKKLSEDVKGQIICLVGPPGVGKTSIVRSIAKSMGRKYVRISLGGVHDEAEVRGHRKTYIGAMQGRIASALESAKSFNPIILLDEIDKVSNDGRSDPSSALLEALDPEQNFSFRDNFLEFPLDLSKVLFITTANDASSIPAPLFDRMDIIELTSYTPEEKFMIAKKHLVKKQLKIHALTAQNLKFTDDVIRYLIDSYTREAGVRKLEKTIVSVIRKCIVKMQDEEVNSIKLTKALVKELLGPEKFNGEKLLKVDTVGVVNGLAWTQVGGELLQVEAVVMDGSGKLEITGNLGEVMTESAKAAHSFIRSKASIYGIDSEVFKKKDIHIHVPQGAVPKDGPSAGVTISTALISALTEIPVKQNVAMTGEISLTGRVMPIGGLKEKSMAAYKAGIKKVLIPFDNLPDLYEVDEVVKQNVEFVAMKSLNEVFEQSLTVKPSNQTEDKPKSTLKNQVKQKKSHTGIIA